MAIRSNELNLTSIIGIGNKFEQISNCGKIEINTTNKSFKIIK